MNFFKNNKAPFLTLMALLAFIYFWQLGAHGLIDPDEGRYSEIPREMLATGDWVTPRLNGVKYFEKPAMYYWLVAGAFKTFGENAFASRFWPATSGLAGAAVTYALGARFSPRAGFISGFIVGTSFLWFALSHISLTDMVLTAFLVCAMYCLFKGAAGNKKWLVAAWFAMALAVLTKGLIGILLPGMVGVCWALLTKRYRLLYRVFYPPAILVFLITVVPWFWLVGSRNPEFYWFFFVHEHFIRYATYDANRFEGLWFFPAILIAGFIPWTGSLFWGLVFGIKRSVAAVKAGRQGVQDVKSVRNAKFKKMGAAKTVELDKSDKAPTDDEFFLFLTLWGVLILIFFCVSRSQLAPYILPVFPPFAALAGIKLDEIMRRNDRQEFLLSFIGNNFFVVLLIAALLIYPKMQDRIDPAAVSSAARSLAFTLLAAGSFPLGVFLLGKGERTLKLVLFMCCLGVVAINLNLKQVFGVFGQIRSAANLSSIIAEHATDDTKIVNFRDYDQGLPFYLKRHIWMVNDGPNKERLWGELSFGQAQENAHWFISPQEFSAMWNKENGIIAVIRPRDAAELEALGVKYKTLGTDKLYYDKTVIIKE